MNLSANSCDTGYNYSKLNFIDTLQIVIQFGKTANRMTIYAAQLNIIFNAVSLRIFIKISNI